MPDLQLYLSPSSWRIIPDDAWKPSACVVIDVLRATSTITTALAHGAEHLLAVAEVEKAEALKNKDPLTLLLGERNHLPLPGFDLGNSPGKCTSERVKGKHLILTTTNGTQALTACRQARSIVAACFLNLDAVAKRLLQQGPPWSIVCAGREGSFGLDDALVASALVNLLRPEHPFAALYRYVQYKLVETLENTESGRKLRSLGMGQDVDFCAQLNLFPIVPVMSPDGSFQAVN